MYIFCASFSTFPGSLAPFVLHVRGWIKSKDNFEIKRWTQNGNVSASLYAPTQSCLCLMAKRQPRRLVRALPEVSGALNYFFYAWFPVLSAWSPKTQWLMSWRATLCCSHIVGIGIETSCNHLNHAPKRSEVGFSKHATRTLFYYSALASIQHTVTNSCNNLLENSEASLWTTSSSSYGPDFLPLNTTSSDTWKIRYEVENSTPMLGPASVANMTSWTTGKKFLERIQKLC